MKKVLFRVLKVIGFSFLGLVTIILVVHFVSAFPKKDFFFVENAEFVQSDFQNLLPDNEEVKYIDKNEVLPIIHLVQNHRIKQGTGFAFGYRYFSAGSIGIDDETYKKITIWIPNLNEDVYQFGNKSKVIGYFAKGGSAWPRNGCGGEIQSGSVKINKSESDQIVLHITGNVDCRRKDKIEKGIIEIDETMTFKKIGFQDLNPWRGIGGTHIYRETYR